MPSNIIRIKLFPSTNASEQNNKVTRDKNVKRRRQAPRDMLLSNTSLLILRIVAHQRLAIEESDNIELSTSPDSTRQVGVPEIVQQITLNDFNGNWLSRTNSRKVVLAAVAWLSIARSSGNPPGC